MHMNPRQTLHRQESVDEDVLFREGIMECMLKAIGLDNVKDGPRQPQSAAQSPRLVSFDNKRQTAIFNSAFGFMDPFGGSGDGDSESIASASAYSAGGPTNILEDLKHEIEIVCFPKGSVLVESGERNPGLYYVIDGFLDVSVPVPDDDAGSSVLGTTPGQGAIDASQLLNSNPKATSSDRSHSFSGAQNPKRKKQSNSKSLFLIKPGGLAGYMGTVSAYR